MAEFWSAPIPRCPVHAGPDGDGGQMSFDFAADAWRCAGWDGEGCDYRVTSEQQDWTALGQAAGPVTWAPPPGDTPWARPDHDVAGDLRAAMRAAEAGATYTVPLDPESHAVLWTGNG